MVWIHVTAHLKKAQLLVRPADEGGGSLAVWHDHDPVVSSQKVEQAGHQILDGRTDRGVIHHVISDTQAKEDPRVLIARRIPYPVITVGIGELGLIVDFH